VSPSDLRAAATRVGARFNTLPGPVRGAVWMIVACLGFACMNLIVRRLTLELHPFEFALLRNLMSLAFMLPWLAHVGLRGISTNHQKLYFTRSLSGFISTLLWFWALATMPLAEATALSFTSPLFATIAAVLILGEVVRLRRWTATVIGFLGVLIVVRPGPETITLAQIMVLLSSCLGGINAVMVKQLSRSDSPAMMVTIQMLWAVPMSLLPAVFVWQMPSLAAWLWAALLGLIASLSHLAMTRSYAAADASAVTPFDFARLPFVALAAWLIYGETPDRWTWIGGAVIFASSTYIAWREGRIARELAQKPQPVAPAASSESGTVNTQAPRSTVRPAAPER
jgi:drug/metabolite transporter (DMT)-like permease